MNNICSAFGHREVYQNIEKEIDKVIIELIEKHNINTFFTGGIGDFAHNNSDDRSPALRF